MTIRSFTNNISASGLLWLFAFICALSPVNEWQVVFFAAALVALFFWSWLGLARGAGGGWLVPRSPVLVFAGLFWAAMFASVFWSEVKPASIMGFCLLSFLPLNFFTGVLAGDRRMFATIAAGLGVIFAGLGIWAMIQFLFLNGYFFGQARHPLQDPSSFGALLSLGLFAGLGWLLLDRPRIERLLATALCAILACGMLATVGRGPALAFLPAFVLLCLLAWPQIRRRWRNLVIVALCGAAFFAAGQAGAPKRFDLGVRLAKTMSSDDVTGNRFNIWAGTLDLIREHPLLGTGVGTFALYYPEYRKYAEIDGVYYAHNDPLQFWAEFGLLGPLAFYAFGAVCLMRMRASRQARGSRTDGREIVAASLFCGLAALMLSSHVGFSLYNASILMLSGIMLALWFRVSGDADGGAVRHARITGAPPGVVKVLIALPFVLIGWMAVSLSAGEYYANRARDNLFAGEMMCLTPAQERSRDCFQENINRAARVSMDMNGRAYLFAVNVPMTILQTGQWQISDPAEQRKLYDQVAYYMDRVLTINPRDPSAHYYLGRVQALVPASVLPKGIASPEAEFRIALKLDPSHLGARMALYQLYRDEGRSTAEQLAVLASAEDFNYATTEALAYYGALSELYLASGEHGKMRDVLGKARKLQSRADFSIRREGTTIPEALTDGMPGRR